MSPDETTETRWRLAFSTLGCPEWSWERIVSEAERLGYDGLELRGVLSELDLLAVPELRPNQIEKTKADLVRRGLSICCLGSSVKLDNEHLMEENIASGKGYIDLARELGAPYVRVFGDRIPDPEAARAVKARIARGLDLLGAYAAEKEVTVLIETHGDFSRSAHLLDVLEQVSSPAVGVLWDMHHPWRMHHEGLNETFVALQPWIRHVHVKDSVAAGESFRYTPAGTGEFPFQEGFELLRAHGYDGWISLEWEKRWVKEIEPPEVAFPGFIELMRRLLGSGPSQ